MGKQSMNEIFSVAMQDQGITGALTTDERFQQAGLQTLQKGVK